MNRNFSSSEDDPPRFEYDQATNRQICWLRPHNASKSSLTLARSNGCHLFLPQQHLRQHWKVYPKLHQRHLWMPQWTPGRNYVLHHGNFERHCQLSDMWKTARTRWRHGLAPTKVQFSHEHVLPAFPCLKARRKNSLSNQLCCLQSR